LDHVARVRKSPVQIRFEILEYLYYNPGPHLRTYVWRRATNLSYDDFLKYLNYIKEKGLVEENEGYCKLTESGKNVYAQLRDSLPSLM